MIDGGEEQAIGPSQAIQERTSKVKRVDISGQFRPEKRGLDYKIRKFFAKSLIKEEMWTEERMSRFPQIVEAVNNQLGIIGANEINPIVDQISSADVAGAGGWTYPISGDIMIDPRKLKEEWYFDHAVAHELFHFASKRMVYQKGRKESLRRVGINLTSKGHLAPLSEAIVETTTIRAMETLPDWGKRGGFYYDYRNLLQNVCDIFSNYDEKGRKRHEIYRLFQKAEFTGEGLLELARIADRAFGEGGLRKLAELISKNKASEVIDKNMLLELTQKAKEPPIGKMH